MMLSLESSLRVVFAVYAVFWVAVVVGAYFGVGALLKHAQRSLEKREPGRSAPGH